MLHLRIQRRRLHSQQARSLRLIAATMIERALDQLDLITLDLVIKIDSLVVEADLFTAVVSRKLNLQTLNLVGERSREQRQLLYALFELRGVVSVSVVYVVQYSQGLLLQQVVR